MRVTFLILVHQKPAQFAELLDAILVSDNCAVVHVDAKADLDAFRRAAARHADRVIFTNIRYNIRWGNFRSVDATVAALKTGVDTLPADYYAVLSGADYPIKPAGALHQELLSGAVYMDCFKMPDARRNKPMSRLHFYYLAFKNRDSLLAMAINEQLLPRLPKRNVRRGLKGAQPYGGSQWWAVPHGCANQMLNFIDASPRFVRFFRYSRNPDEMFFQTVVKALTTPWEIRRKLTFDDWSRPEVRGTSPATLDASDLPTLAAVPHYFARKFDPDHDSSIYVRIREELLAPTAP